METAEKSPQTTAAEPGRLERSDDIAWLVLDDPEKKVNTLSSRLMGWFGEQLTALEADPPPGGLVILSGKSGGFVAGADIEELQQLADPAEVVELLQRGHALTARLAALPVTTVAAIHGACLGGGLELALACDRRVATDDPKTRLGLPEVQLGLIPGLGGTQRLPRLIGVAEALPLILTGKTVTAGKARRLGMVDAVCHPADLATAARRLLERPPGRRGPKGLLGKAVDAAARLPGAKRLVFDQAEKKVMQETGGHYPAPRVAIEVVREGIQLPIERALDFEAGAFSQLVVSDTAKALMGIFFAKNAVERRAAELARDARELPGIGVLGAGFMGAGVAQLASYKGLEVVLKDRDEAALGRGLGQCAKLFDGLAKRRKLRPPQVKEAMGRIRGTVDYAAFARVGFVVEAVFEDLKVKQAVLREVEAATPDELIFASNTSTLPIARIAEASRRPENVVGMHFFSPVHKMPLLEVIRHPGSSKEAVATTVELGRQLGKTVIVVDDGPGFFTSRVLGPFLNEAAWCLAEGATVEQIDGAMKRWGWPVGPLTLLDEVGIDIAGHAGAVMREAFGERFAAPPVMERMVEAGRLGRKGGKGFYDYSGEKSVDRAVYELLDWQAGEVSDEEIVERCWLAMLNETARAMEDGIVSEPQVADIGVIFGLGFPPFRGGLLREADRRGLAAVVEQLEGYAERCGERLRPAPLLTSMAQRGESFYGD